MNEPEVVTPDLNSLFWLGGSTCSGKTTICASLSGRYHVDIQHRDDVISEHWDRADPQNHPAIYEWLRLRQAGRSEELLDMPIDNLVTLMISAFREDFSLTLEDLSQQDLKPRTIIEGMRLLHEALVPLLEEKERAVWLAPSVALYKELLDRRSQASANKNVSRKDTQLREHLFSVFQELATTLGQMAEDYDARVIHMETIDDLRSAPDILANAWHLS